MNYIINFFGTGIRFWVCEIPIPMYNQMNKIKQIKKVEWENLLFDFDFLKHFGYNHWSELSNYPEKIGFLLLHENRIEIKLAAKFITRFRANDIENYGTLFPLYQTSYTQFSHYKKGFQTMVLIQFEKGIIAKYKLETSTFSVDKLIFKIVDLKKYTILSGVEYNQTEQVSHIDDTVTTGFQVIFVK